MACVDVNAPNSGTVVRRRPVARRLDRHEVHREGVPRFGALDVERAGLRVDVRELDDPGDQVVESPDATAEAVLGEQLQHRAGRDAGDRRHAAERPRVLARRRPVRERWSRAHAIGVGSSVVAPACAGGRNPPDVLGGSGASSRWTRDTSATRSGCRSVEVRRSRSGRAPSRCRPPCPAYDIGAVSVGTEREQPAARPPSATPARTPRSRGSAR